MKRNYLVAYVIQQGHTNTLSTLLWPSEEEPTSTLVTYLEEMLFGLVGQQVLVLSFTPLEVVE